MPRVAIETEGAAEGDRLGDVGGERLEAVVGERGEEQAPLEGGGHVDGVDLVTREVHVFHLRDERRRYE